MIALDRYTEVFEQRPADIELCEVNADVHDETRISVRDGRQDGFEAFSRTTLCVRAARGGKVGQAFTERLQDDPAAILQKAAASAEYIDSALPIIADHQSCSHAASDNDGDQAMMAFGVELERAMKSFPGISRAGACTVRRTRQEMRTINSLGADSSWSDSFVMATLAADLICSGKSVHTVITAKAPELAELEPHAIAEAALERASLVGAGLQKGNADIRSGRYAVVLPDTVAAGIMMVAWRTVISPYLSAGQAIFPFDPAEIISYEPLDIPSWGNRTALYRRQPQTVQAGAAISRPLNMGGAGVIMSRPNSMSISPGKAGLSQLIAEMGDGILLTDAVDIIHAVNSATGEFSVICSGILYRGGAPQGAVSRLTMSGDLQGLLRRVRAVGSDQMYTEFMQKKYSYGGASLLVDDMMFTAPGESPALPKEDGEKC